MFVLEYCVFVRLSLCVCVWVRAKSLSELADANILLFQHCPLYVNTLHTSPSPDRQR